MGLYSIAVLEGMEESIDGPIASRFDLLAGTSVGGIIALGLAAEVPARDIKKAFERNGVLIFSAKPVRHGPLGALLDFTSSLFKPKYQSEALRETIIEIVGADTRIGDLRHRVLIPAVNLTRGRPQMFKTPHHPALQTDLKLKVVDVALATSAAPTYFPIAEIADALYVDGGLFANSPDLFAIHEAEHFLGQQREAIYVLSIGTTTAQFSFSHAHGRQFGLFEWSKHRLVNVLISSQQQIVDSVVGQQLGSRYLRIDTQQSREQERELALDVATQDAQRTIRGLAAGSLQAHVNDARLPGFLSHVVSEPRFFYKISEAGTVVGQ